MSYLRVFIFIALLGIGYVGIAFSIPQVDSQPPKVEKFDPSKVKTKEDIASIGQKIFYGKGQCSLCHSIAPSESSRCPAQQGFGDKLTREFLYESLVNPADWYYINYEGHQPSRFPAVMPAINKPPVDLNEQELLAVIAFVQKGTGGVATIEPAEFLAAGAPVGAAPVSAGDAQSGNKVFAKLECVKCHKLGQAGGTAPDLIAYVTSQDEANLRSNILNAKEKTDAGKTVKNHLDFDQKLTVKELNDLLAYLKSLKS